jgi:hypothetical protein
MKAILSVKRTFPPGLRQDGFQSIPIRARYDFIKEAEVNDDVKSYCFFKAITTFV